MRGRTTTSPSPLMPGSYWPASTLCSAARGGEVDEMTFGNTALDLSTSTLMCGQKQVRLSAKEFDIMRYLLQSGEKNLPKEVILARVWGYDSEAVENHVEVYVGFLRKKLRSIGSDIHIQAVRKLGYHLEVSESD